MERQRGFTIVELMVTMAIGSLLVVASIGMYLAVLGQSPVIKERNTLSTNLQNALNRINDDVRRASNITTFNLVADPNAPTTKTGYENVPGPNPDTNDQHFWRMGENRLLINQTPVNAAGNPIYDNAEFAAGQKNTIVYYVKDGALFRRVIAAPYGTNAVTTATCSRVAAGGCENSDTMLLDNLKESMGAAAFKVTYYDRNGNAIPYTSKDDLGNDVPDYTGFPLTRSIGVDIELESDAAGQTVSLSNSMRMQFRSQLNVVPTEVVEPYVPPTNGLGEPGLMVGPGGLDIYNTTVQGGDVYVKGKVNVAFNSRIGGGYIWEIFSGGGKPINLNVANVAITCTDVNGVYPSPCGSASPPITIATNASASINGRVCAKDQVTATNINAYGGEQGLIPDCSPPDADLPTFDKGSFVTGLTNGTLPASTASCSNENKTIAAGRTYTGNMNWTFFCSISLAGSTYITGNLTANNTTIRVSEAAGKVRPIVVVNGKINFGSFTRIQPNSFGTTPYFISFFSADSACSNSDSCTIITSAKLKETLDTYTGTNAPISLGNVTATGTSFYAYYGEAYLHFFTRVGAVGGQRVKTNNAEITLDVKL